MSSRESILAAIAQNQPEQSALPDLAFFDNLDNGELSAADKFINVLTTIGGAVQRVGSYNEIIALIQNDYQPEHRVITLIPELQSISRETFAINPAAHHLHDVELAVLKGHFGVAENGAIWLTEDMMGHRALPFIAQHLALVIREADIVYTMHEAYDRIGRADIGFGTFISGPSKTADIEQSLVLGAHGARSMTVYLLA